MTRNKLIELQQIKIDLFKSQDPETGLFDVVFEFEGKRLYAHKAMLNLVSDTFKAMISDLWTSKDEPIKLQDYTFDEFYQFLTFLYSGECQLTDKNVASMVDIAEFYQVECFKDFCDEYLSKLTLSTEVVVKYLELADKYSLTLFDAAVQSFVSDYFSNFVYSEAVKSLKKSILKKVVVNNKDIVKPEEIFEVVYKWTENQVLLSQEIDPLLSQNDAIKSEISDFLPFIDFNKMEMPFLLQCVLPRIFVFPSLDEISKIIYGVYSKKSISSKRSVFSKKKVTVTNGNGRKLYGYIMPEQTDIEKIKSLKLSVNARNHSNCWWEDKFKIPSAPSSLKKRDGVQWYLLYFADGEIGIVHHEDAVARHYLLAEMSPEKGKEFSVTRGCKIQIE